jgi:hypothetical protein
MKEDLKNKYIDQLKDLNLGQKIADLLLFISYYSDGETKVVEGEYVSLHMHKSSDIKNDIKQLNEILPIPIDSEGFECSQILNKQLKEDEWDAALVWFYAVTDVEWEEGGEIEIADQIISSIKSEFESYSAIFKLWVLELIKGVAKADKVLKPGEKGWVEGVPIDLGLKQTIKFRDEIDAANILPSEKLLGIAKKEHISSNMIRLLSYREDLDNKTREIIDFKQKFAELNEQHKDDSSYAWLEESLLSITDWGRDIFESIYLDQNEHIRKAVSKNTFLPKEFSDKYKVVFGEFNEKLDLLSDKDLPVEYLEDLSKDKSNYNASRIRKAVALHPNTPLNIIESLLKDDARWVRESAAMHPNINQKIIAKMTSTADRYILIGFSKNPNCDKESKTNILTMLEDLDKYPIQGDEYELFYTSDYLTATEGHGGGVSNDEVINAILEGESWHDYVFYNDWHEFGDSWSFWGVPETPDFIKYPDGEMSPINIPMDENDPDTVIPTIEDNIPSSGSGFLCSHLQYNSGTGADWQGYVAELEYELIPEKIEASYEYGMCSCFEYCDETRGEAAGTFEEDGMWGFTDITTDFYLYYYDSKDPSIFTEIAIEDLIEEIKGAKIDDTNEAAVKKYLEKHYPITE